ncbi:hypothetical protein UA45_08610 [Morganella morganii]|uniref:Uncharacterized protein n=1 Tax=Morganella morganii TaxID=582 RepID=A0A0D8LAA1_MORMO|nr:hypothetical protein UA45_08610 [Morganella morganii]
MARSRDNAACYTLLLITVAVALTMSFTLSGSARSDRSALRKVCRRDRTRQSRPGLSAAVLIRGNLLIRSITRKSVMKKRARNGKKNDVLTGVKSHLNRIEMQMETLGDRMDVIRQEATQGALRVVRLPERYPAGLPPVWSPQR